MPFWKKSELEKGPEPIANFQPDNIPEELVVARMNKTGESREDALNFLKEGREEVGARLDSEKADWERPVGAKEQASVVEGQLGQDQEDQQKAA